MTNLISVKTADLVGEQLAWAVGKAEGLDVKLEPPIYGNPWRVFARYTGEVTVRDVRYDPHENWALAGQLIPSREILIGVSRNPLLSDSASVRISHNGDCFWQSGPTPLIALCRAIAAAEIGDTVQVPMELMT